MTVTICDHIFSSSMEHADNSNKLTFGSLLTVRLQLLKPATVTFYEQDFQILLVFFYSR
jgi:hypothetical protein